MSKGSESSAAATAGMVTAAFMIAHQVAAKATRDALFLSNFDITALPSMLIGASLLAIVSVIVTSRILTKMGPARLIPPAFAISAILLMVEWQLQIHYPRIGAVLVFGHIAAFGSVLISGFWSLVNERFDPRSARKLVARIGTGGTLGGLAGGLLAAKAADNIPVSTMIPILALLHASCALILLRLRSGVDASPVSISGETPFLSGVHILRERPYLRNLAVFILLGTISAALIDYVFKASASSNLTEADNLLRFFAYYYTVIGLCSVVIQSSLSHLSLKKLGLAKTVGTLPTVIILGSFGAFLLPSLMTAALARGAEAVIRNSLFRSAYEVLYTPIPAGEKRATKSIIDVGFERIGDALGGGITRLILLIFTQAAQSVMLIMAFTLALVGLYITKRLHQGYVSALERSLRARAVELDISEIQDKTTRQTLLTIALPADFSDELSSDSLRPPSTGIAKGPPSGLTAVRMDATLKRIGELSSGDPETVKNALKSGQPLDPGVVPFTINLLAWDEVALDAIRLLRSSAKSIAGQLVDHLLDPSQAFAIRRRLPRVLSAAPIQRTANGLLLGLRDQRFEVRYQCSRALSSVFGQNADLEIDSEKVFAAAAREVRVDRRVWESHRLLDQFEETEKTAFSEDEYLKERANRSLEHVFTILSLALPKEPLKIAYRGLHTDDKNLRGTALEYLATILPVNIRESLWPFLEGEPKLEPVTKSREQILDELMKSNRSIEISLEQIRKLGLTR